MSLSIHARGIQGVLVMRTIQAVRDPQRGVYGFQELVRTRSVEFMDFKDVFILIKTRHVVMILYECVYCLIYSFDVFML
jgi:hypothetical protein